MKTKILIMFVVFEIFAGVGNSQLEKSLQGLWVSNGDIKVNLSFHARGCNGNAWAFNININGEKHRGYIKTVLGKILDMNINGSCANWIVIKKYENELILRQSGFLIFPNDEISLRKDSIPIKIPISGVESILEGFWRANINDMQINISIGAPGCNGNIYAFNAIVEYTKCRGYIKSITGKVLDMNINGESATWFITKIENNGGKITLFQSGTLMFPTMDEIVLIKSI